MSRTSKEHEIPREHTPIPDLYSLYVYSWPVEQDAMIGIKYPKISFSSERVYDVFDMENNEVWVRLFGEFAVPLFADQERAFIYLKELITPTDYIAYFVHLVDDDSVLIWGIDDNERLLITYDRAKKVISDIQNVTGTIGAYCVSGHS